MDICIDEIRGRGMYDDHIEKVKPIVEKYGGTYLVRTEKVTSLHPMRSPQRVIIIEFPNRKSLDACFSSDDYKKISDARTGSVDARAVIAEG